MRNIFISIIFLCLLFIPSHTQASESFGKLGYCKQDVPIFNKSQPRHICYIMQSGDTLWSIAEKYYGSGFDWRKIKVFKGEERLIQNHHRIESGVQLVIYKEQDLSSKRYPGYPLTDSFGIDSETGEIYQLSRHYGSGAVINVGADLYDGPFPFIKYFTIDEKTNHRMYLADTDEKSRCVEIIGQYHGFRFIFNKKQNPHYSCGWDYQLLIFSPDGVHYALRNNEGTNRDHERFLVLSDLGNGPYYDYIDSLIWFDDDTLVYRAQNDDEWRIVVNHKDYQIFDYLENLKLEGGVIKFDARYSDQSWSKEEIRL